VNDTQGGRVVATHRATHHRTGRHVLAITVVICGLAATLAACSEDRTSTSGAPTTVASTCSSADLLTCARRSSISDLVPDQPTPATGQPITIGMINQENTPAGSFPELSQTAQAFAKWFNTELGGIDGRPLRIDVCNTGFSAEGSTACGQRFAEAGVPAVLGGIDVFGNAIDSLADNAIPYAGGIPVSVQSMTSPTSFQWSGGTWGAAVGFADYIARVLKAERVAIVYGDFGSIADGAREGEAKLRELGVSQVQLVPFPVISTDLGSPLQAAWSSKPDAIVVLAADTACKAAFDAVHTIGITSQMFYVGACATPNVTNAVGDKANGAYFNVEGPVDAKDPDPDTELYTSVLAAMDPAVNPVGAGTVSARSLVNLYAVMRDLGADRLDAASITQALRSQRGTSSFMGHDYTCDGQQFPGLPATCSPQQIIVRLDSGVIEQVSDWIDVGG